MSGPGAPQGIGPRDTTASAITAWATARRRVAELVRGAGPEALERPVPACPDWSGTDLLRHMVGLAADVLDGDEPEDHNPAWTQAQVEARRHLSAEDVLAEWEQHADPLVAWMGEHGTRPLNDVVIHEQDLRGSLGVPGGRDSDGLALVRGRMGGRLADRLADVVPVHGDLALVGETGRWSTADAGAGTSAGDTGPVSSGLVLQASDFDLARALMTRRTAAQLASYVVRGDLEPYLEGFAVLGALPATPLPE